MKNMIPVGTLINDPVLVCPICGDNMIHPVAIECRSPGTEEGHVRIDANGVHLDPTKPAIDSGVMITLKFYCECAHVFEYEFHFNQGKTYLKRRMRELPDDCDCSLRTIWRN